MHLNILPNTWLTKKLGDIFSLSAGGDVDKSLFSEKQDEVHPYPIYANALTNQGLYGYSSDYRVGQESITITGRGDIGKVFYRKGKYTPIVRLVVGIPKDNISAKYMSYACSKIRFFNETTGVPQLTVPQVASYKVLVPPLAEQEKIAEILSCWDDAIEQQADLIAEKKQQKKAIMQKLLTGKQRLPGFKQKWELVKLSDILIERIELTTEINQVTILTSSRKGIFKQEDYFDKSVASANNIGYKIIHKGDFTYRAMTDDDTFRFNELKNLEFGAVSPAYAVFYCPEMPNVFLDSILNSNDFVNKLKKIAQGGTRKSLKFSSLQKLQILIPTDKIEQKAIADVLLTVDAEIDLLKRQLDAITEQKRGLMQKLLTGQIRVKVDKK